MAQQVFTRSTGLAPWMPALAAGSTDVAALLVSGGFVAATITPVVIVAVLCAWWGARQQHDAVEHTISHRRGNPRNAHPRRNHRVGAGLRQSGADLVEADRGRPCRRSGADTDEITFF